MSVSYANSWRDWSLSVMGNYSFNRNKVLEDDSTVAYPWQKTIGNKVDQRFGLIALGLFESPEEIAAAPVQVGDTRPGDIRYKDINGDGKIDEYDKVPIRVYIKTATGDEPILHQVLNTLMDGCTRHAMASI